MEVLDITACTNDYTAATTIQDAWNANGGWFSVDGGRVYMSLQYGGYGDPYWTPDIPVPPGVGSISPLVVGIKFKNRPGDAATVTAVMPDKGEPSVQLAAGGQINSLGIPTRIVNVLDTVYGADPTGATDSSAAFQAAANATMTLATGGQGAILLAPPGHYKWLSPVVAQPVANDGAPVIFSGYGAVIDASTVAGTAALRLTCGTRVWRNWILEGFYFLGGSAAKTDVIRVEDGSGTGFMYNFKIRDIAIEGEMAANGLHMAALTGSGLFEYQLERINVDMTGNTTTLPVWVDVAAGAPQGSSSVDLVDIDTRGGLRGLQVGSSPVPTRANIIGGTFLTAQQEGIAAFLQGGDILHPHVEQNWQGAANLAAGGGGIYLEGWANVVGLEDVRGGTSKQKWALDAFIVTGQANIVGMPAGSTFPFLRLRNNAAGSGAVNLLGIPASELDVTALTSGAVSPQVNGTPLSGRYELAYGVAVNVDASKGGLLTLNVTNGVAFTVNAPTNALNGQTITFLISNSSGGALGAVTWAAAYHLAGAFVNPANGFTRTITFTKYAVGWYEDSRAAADIP